MTLRMKCLDRISSLTDDILGHVLSFLPTSCAVRTSVLSTRWRYLFTFTTCLSFDDAPCFGQMGSEELTESTRRFAEFVDKVLDSHQISPILRFSLVCWNGYDASDLNRWFSTVLGKGVREFEYQLGDQCDSAPDYDGFFVCETLTSLKMIGRWHYAIKIPLSAWLPNLKVLHLDRIVFLDFSSVQRLFSSCALLEELTLSTCGCDYNGHIFHRTEMLKVLTLVRCWFLLGTLVIDAPNLLYLTYTSNAGVNIVPSWKHSSSLAKADLSFYCSTYDDFDTNKNSVKYDRELLKAAAYKATKIRFEMDSIQLILTLDDVGQMPDFPNLSTLHIGNCPYETWEYVTSLIDKSPQLETVIYESGFRCCYCSYHDCADAVCYCDSLTPSDIPLGSFSCQARLIEVHNFCGHKGSLSLTGHLLRNASVLEKLILHRRESYSEEFDLEDELKISRDLLMLPKAAKDCYVELNLACKIHSLC